VVVAIGAKRPKACVGAWTWLIWVAVRIGPISSQWTFFFPEFDTAVSSLVGQVRSRAFQVRCQEHIDIVPVKLRCHCQSGQVRYTPRSRLGPGTSVLAVGFLPITSPEVQHPRLQCSKRIVTAQEFPNTKYQVCSRNIQSFAFLRTSNKTIFHISDPNHWCFIFLTKSRRNSRN